MFAGRPTDARVCVVCNIYETYGVYHTYAEQPQGTLVALVGSAGRLELAIVGDNAAAARRVGSRRVGTPRGGWRWESIAGSSCGPRSRLPEMTNAAFRLDDTHHPPSN